MERSTRIAESFTREFQLELERVISHDDSGPVTMQRGLIRRLLLIAVAGDVKALSLVLNLAQRVNAPNPSFEAEDDEILRAAALEAARHD